MTEKQFYLALKRTAKKKPFHYEKNQYIRTEKYSYYDFNEGMCGMCPISAVIEYTLGKNVSNEDAIFKGVKLLKLDEGFVYDIVDAADFHSKDLTKAQKSIRRSLIEACGLTKTRKQKLK